MGATRDIALTNLPFRGLSINPTTADGSITVVASDSGTMFINKYAGSTTYTLPPVAEGAGKWFWFYAAVAEDVLVTAQSAIMMVADNLTQTTITSNGTIGDCLFVIGDGTNWFAFMVYATWT